MSSDSGIEMTMTWPRLRGKTYSLMGRSIRATVHYPDGRTGRVWSAPGRWRLDADGVIKELSNDVGRYFRGPDGTMRLIRKQPNVMHAFTSSGIDPVSLLEPHRRWSSSFVGRDGELTPTRITEVVHGGRRAWSVEFDTSSYVLDDETGVALAYRNERGSMELSDPVLDEEFPETLFEWNGEVEEARTIIRNTRDDVEDRKRRGIEEMEMSLPTWLPVRARGQQIDGDPATGALDVRLMGGAAMIDGYVRRWPTVIPEPPFTGNPSPVTARTQKGPWTIEVRLSYGRDPADARRIAESVVDLPEVTLSPEVLRQIAADSAEAADDMELNLLLADAKPLAEHSAGRYADSLLVRSDFSDDDAWRRVAKATIAIDDEFEARPGCRIVADRSAEGITPEQLVAALPEHSPCAVFVADAMTMTHKDMPLLAVDIGPLSDTRGQSFRVIPAEVLAIEANLSISNMDFDDFASGARRSSDGIFRGFPEPRYFSLDELTDLVARLPSTPVFDSLRADMNRDLPRPTLGDVNGATTCDQYLSWQYRPVTGYLGEEDFVRVVRPLTEVTVTSVMIDRGYWSIALSPDCDEVLAAIRIRRN